jgi:hypothetical protein
MLQQRHTQCPQLELLVPLIVKVRIGEIVTGLFKDDGRDYVCGQ